MVNGLLLEAVEMVSWRRMTEEVMEEKEYDEHVALMVLRASLQGKEGIRSILWT